MVKLPAREKWRLIQNLVKSPLVFNKQSFVSILEEADLGYIIPMLNLSGSTQEILYELFIKLEEAGPESLGLFLNALVRRLGRAQATIITQILVKYNLLPSFPSSLSDEKFLRNEAHQGYEKGSKSDLFKKPDLYDTNDIINGISFSEWTTKWWQWISSIPADINPANDHTSDNSARYQENPYVWFLAGTTGGSDNRFCVLPVGKSILLPIIASHCSFAKDKEIRKESDLRSCAQSKQDKVKYMKADIDEEELGDLNEYRIQSPLFELHLTENNLFGLEAGTTQAVSDGRWLFLKPLAEGSHVIHSIAREVDPDFMTEVTYRVLVTH